MIRTSYFSFFYIAMCLCNILFFIRYYIPFIFISILIIICIVIFNIFHKICFRIYTMFKFVSKNCSR